MLLAAASVIVMIALAITLMVLWGAFRGLMWLIRFMRRTFFKPQVKPQPF